MTKPISREDKAHVDNLIKWAAQAAARGDMDSSQRLLDGAHKVFDRAVTAANPSA